MAKRITSSASTKSENGAELEIEFAMNVPESIDDCTNMFSEAVVVSRFVRAYKAEVRNVAVKAAAAAVAEGKDPNRAAQDAVNGYEPTTRSATDRLTAKLNKLLADVPEELRASAIASLRASE